MTFRLIGGEMLLWSDLGGSPGPVRGGVLDPLVAAAAGRTLVAGPHDPALIDLVPGDDLTVLVRGVPDAEALAARYADRPGVTVCCGTPEKLAGEPPYDTVIALDGVERLSSVEAPQLGWGPAVEALLGVLRPGGTLLLGVENFLGVHRLVALPGEPADAQWVTPGEYDDSRPAGLARVRSRLTAAGLDVARTYAAYPAPTAPAALLGEEVLADGELRGFLHATLRRVCTPSGDVLSDPRWLAVNALRHDAAALLAPAWVLVARRPAAAGTDTAAPGGFPDAAGDFPDAAGGFPDAVVDTGPARQEIRREPGGRWVRGLGGGVRPVPVGRTVEELMTAACRVHDLPTVRAVLGAWQGGATAGVPADQVIVGPDGRTDALVPAGTPAAALRDLAGTLLADGSPVPWPGAADPAELALTLAAMTGREPDPADADGTDGTDGGRAGTHRARGVAPGLGLPDAHALTTLRASHDRLAAELAQARAQIEWFERTLTGKEDALRRAERIIELLGDTGPARLGKAFLGGVRVARRSARATIRAVRIRG